MHVFRVGRIGRSFCTRFFLKEGFKTKCTVPEVLIKVEVDLYFWGSSLKIYMKKFQ